MDKREKVMMVDDNLTNLAVGKGILKDVYEVYALSSAAKLFELAAHVTPSLILLDIEMPDMDGYEALCRIKLNPVLADVPVIFLTACKSEGSELTGLSLGAVDYVAKPFSAPLLRKRIENHLLITAQRRKLRRYADDLEEMVYAKTMQVENLQSTVLATVSDMVEFRDGATGGHAMRTQQYLQILAEELMRTGIYAEQTAAWDMRFLIPSAQLHDVGKIAISDSILNKPGPLNKEEFEMMKKHVEYGVAAIRSMQKRMAGSAFLRHAEAIAATHHERWNGTGYPCGLAGDAIALEGRLMAIADVYDAVISARPYKNCLSHAQAAHIIRDGKGEHFDPALVDVFCRVEDQFAAVADCAQEKIA
ncbi:MAG: response regulator [Oscillospiraceae bacterium]|nr:response regulator [Oscillospiraceae bacterium]